MLNNVIRILFKLFLSYPEKEYVRRRFRLPDLLTKPILASVSHLTTTPFFSLKPPPKLISICTIPLSPFCPTLPVIPSDLRSGRTLVTIFFLPSTIDNCCLMTEVGRSVP
ncbi:hypothetical protein AVEN_94588-1 [Araneus ventricosus]|uniref:Uncharacterized protein n=1 Tax=Araneus ventricosus TaxID=182803 RepID=A0A4Y2ILC9_ARAVE|nr:hypothetical protein AVEN_94588-1 [Araneus ventricosus]